MSLLGLFKFTFLKRSLLWGLCFCFEKCVLFARQTNFVLLFFRLGTTKKGIGPTYASKVLNIFIRFLKKSNNCCECLNRVLVQVLNCDWVACAILMGEK